VTQRVLVVEDSPTQAEELRLLLEEGGYAVAVAADGLEGLARARAERPDVIISDVLMPEMDGYAFCAALKADSTLKEIPVLLVTILSGIDDIVRALECGADNVIRKPYEGGHLVSRIRYVLANRELRELERTRMAMEIVVDGRRHFINAERWQTLDLLISSYEEAVRLNKELSARQNELERSKEFLQGLYRIAEGLNREASEQEIAETVVARALELPGIQAGWMSLREGASGFRLAAAKGLPPALLSAGALEGDCACRRGLLAGELDDTTNILECERLQKARAGTRGLRCHASIPLWVGDRTLGVLNLAAPGTGLFTDEDLKILHGVGNQVAIALERVRLLGRLEEETRRRTAALEREVVERELAEKTGARQIAILEATSDFVAMSHADGRVTYYNRAARRLLGIGEEEDISAIRIAETHPEWAGRIVMNEAIPAAIREGIWSGETALLSRDGREIPVLQVIIAHKSPEGSVEFLSTIARDITQWKRAEEAVRRSEKLADMGMLLAGVAHELNNPLTVVTGRANLLRQAYAGEPLAAQVEQIAQAAERCARIVRNFLALARQHPPERREVQLNQVVREALELLTYPLRVENVEIVVDLADDLPPLWGDVHQLHQVVVNLVSNAHQAMHQVSGPRRLSLSTRSDPQRGYVHLEVADTGPGIPPEIRASIFEPFFTTKPTGQGTGLGLSLCRGIVENHGGLIRVESEPGQGAAFLVELPLGVAAGTEAQPEGSVSSSTFGGKAVLVVDDEPEITSLLADLLAAHGCLVETASNGVEALATIRDRVFDVILSDLRMPELDGPGLYRAIERYDSRLLRRIVFLTGDTLDHEIKEFLEQTAALSVNKPFDQDEVIRAVGRVLAITGNG
jgi:PAS domain S-box-containing protein